MLSTVAALKPLINTVEETPPVIGLPHAEVSFRRAAPRPSKITSDEPVTNELVP
ncbi:hypothetical protein QNM99_27065 [Pseudomonas sp. PCH446]